VAGAQAAAAIHRHAPAAPLRAVHDWLARPDHTLVTLADAHYPPRLRHIPDPPPLLYVAGDAALLAHPALAVVGSRSPTPRGAADARAFSRALSECGLCIVSGMAVGIDAAAHVGALEGGARSIAVVGTGVDRVYPRGNAELARALSARGALVSELPLGTPPLRANFPRRNRIISGMSLGCLVVEAAMHSGSLITAKQAADQGREVFALPGSIHSPLAKGCHWLIKQGAKLVENAADVLEELGMDAPLADAHSPAPRMDTREAQVLEALGSESLSVDALCERTGLTADVASAMLLALELDGHVARLPGGFYQCLH